MGPLDTGQLALVFLLFRQIIHSSCAFNPPLYPCSVQDNNKEVDYGKHSPNWFKEKSTQSINLPISYDVPPITQVWTPDYETIFIGYGMYTGHMSLVVSRRKFVVTYPQGSSPALVTVRQIGEIVNNVQGDDVFNSAGFIPDPSDLWAWLTVSNRPYVYIIYLKQVHFHSEFESIHHWKQKITMPGNLHGCSSSDHYVGQVLMVCLTQEGIVTMFQFQPIEVWRSGISNPFVEILYYREHSRFTTALLEGSLGIHDPFPIHLSNEGRLSHRTDVFYRCGATNEEPDRAWCFRSMTDGGILLTGEKTFLTTEFIYPANSGMFIGGFGDDSHLVYFFNRVTNYIYTFHVGDLEGSWIKNTPMDVYKIPRPDSDPLSKYFYGFAMHNKDTDNMYFYMSFGNKVREFQREECVPCTNCSSLGKYYASGQCNTLHNVDTECTPCATCSEGQYIKGGTCREDRDSECVWCVNHYPCLDNSCGFEHCPDGQYLSAACDGTGLGDVSRCIPCNNTCPFNQYRGSNCHCTPCSTTTGSCNPGQYIAACNGTEDSDVSRCMDCEFHPNLRPCGTLLGNKYHSSTCETGNDISDVSSCEDCSVQENSCANNQKAILCSASSTSDTSTCIPCEVWLLINSRPIPGEGTYYDGSTGFCSSANCQDIQCNIGEFRVGCDGTGTSDDYTCVESPFSCNDVCPHTQFQVLPCDYGAVPPQQRVCANCTICQEGQYVDIPCLYNADTVCGVCSPRVSCDFGKFWKECSASEDGTCQTCATPECVLGQYRTGCSGTEDYTCTACSSPTCGAEEYATECTLVQDSVCTSCDAPCGAGEWEVQPCTGTTNRVCAPCSLCSPGEFIYEQCSGSSDTICTSCSSPCISGVTWEEVACSNTGFKDRHCAPCRLCSESGETEVSQCTPTNNTVCTGSCSETQCTLGVTYWDSYQCSGGVASCVPCSNSLTCDGGEFLSLDCTLFHDTQCATCKAACPLGTWEVGQCDSDSDLACKTCSAGICPTGQYQSSACSVSGGDRKCSLCRPPCGDGEYESVQCTFITDRVCTPCSDVPSGYYKSGGCTGSQSPGYDTTFTQCTSAGCAPGYYQSGVCSFESDNVCSQCFPAFCSIGEYEYSPCTLESNRECRVCDYGVCPDGQYISSQCTGTSNQVCSICNTSCAQGYYNPGTGCSGMQNTVCSPCSPDMDCPAGQYQSSTCTSTADRICTNCAPPCPSGYYEETACTSAHDRVCKQCTSDDVPCAANSYLTASCSSTADRVCTSCGGSCGAGTFESQPCDANNDHVCTQCTPCQEGEFRVQWSCTGNFDSACV